MKNVLVKAALSCTMLLPSLVSTAGEKPSLSNSVALSKPYNDNSDDIGGTHFFLGFSLGYSFGKTIIANETNKGGGFTGGLELGLKIPLASRTTEYPSILSVSAALSAYTVKKRTMSLVTAPILYNRYFAWKNSAAIFWLVGTNVNYLTYFGKDKEDFSKVLNTIVVDPCAGIGFNQPLHVVDRRTGRTMFNGRVSAALVVSYTVMDPLKGPDAVRAFYPQVRYNYIF